MASLCDAFQVPKPLSPQLLPFGKSDDDLEELTFEVGRFSVLSARGGRSAWCRQTVRAAPVRRGVLCVLASFHFDPVLLQVFVAAGLWTVRASVADGPGPARTVRLAFADGSFSRVGSGGSVCINGRSAV
jgi:hypothetical protein